MCYLAWKLRKKATAETNNTSWYDMKSKQLYEETESLVKDYLDRPAILEAMVLLQLDCIIMSLIRTARISRKLHPTKKEWGHRS